MPVLFCGVLLVLMSAKDMNVEPILYLYDEIGED